MSVATYVIVIICICAGGDVAAVYDIDDVVVYAVVAVGVHSYYVVMCYGVVVVAVVVTNMWYADSVGHYVVGVGCEGGGCVDVGKCE